MKKRVLQFIGSFHSGGSERQAVELTRLLKNEGSFDVFAATLNNEGVLRADVESIGLPEIPEFPLTSFFDANFVLQMRRCVRYLREQGIDVVHAHDFYTNIFGITAANLARVPVKIASKRETIGMRSGPQKAGEHIALRQANAIVANADAVEEHLAGRGFPREKIFRIHNGIDVEKFYVNGMDRSAARRKFGLATDGNIRFVTMVANLRHDVKNVPMLLRAATKIVPTHQNVRFVIAGEGDLMGSMKELAREMGVADDVSFIGRCNDVPALLGLSTIGVLTSKAEGFSNSILEYMAAGKPVVATDVGGAAEAIVEGKTGFLVPSDDDNALADRLMEMLGNDPRSTEFGVLGKRVAEERFSQDAWLRSTVDLYNSLLDQGN